MVKIGRILGIDYGTKRIGVALTDELGISVKPIGIFSPETILKELSSILSENKVRVIAVGNPMSFIGIINPIKKEVEKFVKDLENFLEKENRKIEVRLVDERGTSKNAEEIIKTFPKKKREALYKKVDSFAACEIAMRYSDSEL